MIKKYSLIFVALFCFVLSGFGQVTIASDGLNNSSTLFTLSGGQYYTGNSATVDIPATSPFASEGTHSFGVSNGAAILLSNSINTSAYTNIELNLKLASFSVNTSSNGADAGDIVTVEISPNGGANWYSTLRVLGNNNAYWSYSTGIATALTVYDGNTTPADFQPSAGGNRTSDGYGSISITDLPSSNDLRVRITLLNNVANERWLVDDVEIIGTLSSPTPTITATPTTLTGLDYVETLGPSSEQSFDVEGTLLTNDITLTAPTNFEISTTSGSSFGTTVTLTESGGTVNATTIYVRMVSGLLNANNPFNGNITATSTGATSQTIAIDGTVTLPGGSNCNELFISEYVEGSSNNKYIEIYNPTGATVNLANYRIAIYSNGSASVSGSFNLMGNLSSYGTYVIANTQATIYTGADATNNAVTGFNGNDAVALQSRPSNLTIDVIGIIGNNAMFGDDVTLRRKSTIQNPNTTYTVTEWDSYPQDTVFDLGNHLSDCEVPTPELQLVDDTATNQNCGYTINFGTLGSNFGTRDLTFDIHNVGSADLEINSLTITGDYTIISPLATPFTITSGNIQTVTVQFAPTANGTRNGVLTINNNDLDEGTCVVNLTGIGVTPTPEIDIERSTGSSIPNGSTPNPGYSTIFASTVMGNSTSPRAFYVSSEGTANLNLISIVSSNPGEFPISLNPGASTLSPGTKVNFEITFSPTGVGTRNATITIRSNDADEDPYTFDVRGNGDCASGILTFLPTSGPVGTIVHVNSSTSHFGGSTSASVNGVAANVTVLSNNQLEVTIPDGATTGSIEINDDLGCLSSEAFTVTDLLISDCEGSSGSTPNNLFISEVTDHGSGSHSFVEIFNGTGTAVNLTDYQIRIHNNGAATPTHTIPLIGTIANNAVFVLAFGAGDATAPHGSYTANQFSIATGINDNDHIRLFNSTTNTWIDLWGDISGDVFTIASKNYTYRRKNSGIVAPSTTWIESDWTSFTPVNYDDIGLYDFSVGTPPTITIQPNLPLSNCDLTASISVTAAEGVIGGNPLAYQWYFSAPGDTGWTVITDGTLYSGSITDTLNILDALSLDNYQFYCQVRENTATCYTASNAVRLQVARTIWDGTTWSPTAPNINTIAYISGNYTTGSNGSFSACQLYVDPTFVLTISNNTYVEVQNNIELAGEIHVATSGSLVQVNDLGSITLTNAAARNILSKLTHPLQNWYDYTYWSSPLENAQIQTALADSRANRRFIFRADLFEDLLIENTNTGTFTSGQDDIDDNGFDWENQPTGSMVPGVGYAATHNNSSFTPGQKPYAFDGTLASGGTFNNGVISVPIYVDPAAPYNNWNFIGNPYPSAINAMDFFSHTASFLESVIYFWSHYTNPDPNAPGNQNLNFSKDDYAMLNIVGGVATGHSPATGPSRIPNGYIASGQGFFVIANKSSGTAGSHNQPVFNNAMRVTENNDQFFRTSTNENKIWVNLSSDNGAFNQVLIGYVEGATDDVDGMQFDALRNLSSGTNVVLYSIISNSDKKFAIQAKEPNSLSLDEVIPLGFYTSIDVATLYTLSVQQFEGVFFTENEVFVKDNLLQLVHNLSTLEYSFTSEVGEFNNRFELVFKNSFLSIDDNEISANQVSIIEHANGEIQFTVPSQYEIKAVEIIDLLGRTIYKLKGNSSSETYDLSNLSQATYIAKITLSDGQVLAKKAVKRR